MFEEKVEYGRLVWLEFSEGWDNGIKGVWRVVRIEIIKDFLGFGKSLEKVWKEEKVKKRFGLVLFFK